MIHLSKLRLFPFKTNEIYFPGNMGNETPYNIIFYSENSNFNLAYRKMKIGRRFVRYGTMLQSKSPKVIYTRENTVQYLLFGIIPVRTITSTIKNIFVDTTRFVSKIDEVYRKGSYRRTIVLTKILAYLRSCASNNTENRKNILIYYVDLTQDIPSSMSDKRAWPLLTMFKNEEYLDMSYILLAVWNGKKINYSLLKNEEQAISWARFVALTNSFKKVKTSEMSEDDNDDVVNDLIVNSTLDEESEDYAINLASSNHKVSTNKEIESITMGNNQTDELKPSRHDDIETKGIVKSYLRTRPTLVDKLKCLPLTPYTSKRIVVASILSRNTRSDSAVKATVQSIEPRMYKKTIEKLQKQVVPTMLKHDAYENEARRPVYSRSSINAINNHKNPSSLLNKRKSDFNESLDQDLIQSFSLLSKDKKHFPLAITNIQKEAIEIVSGDLEPTKMTRYMITLHDDQKKQHVINIDIPTIQADGTFLINGRKKFMMYQMVIDPIFFLKKDEGTLQTMYAPVRITLKETKLKSYFTIYISGYVLPLSLFFCYYIGFKGMCELFKLTPMFFAKNDDVPEGLIKINLADGSIMAFKTQEKHKIALVNSFSEIDVPITKEILFNKQMLTDVIINQLKNRNSIFKIDQIILNIMEPIALQVLKAKLLPTQLDKCLYYITYYIAKGRVDARNDITKQRIRTSEVISFQIQKQILKSYSQYLTDREHGNEDAQFFCDTREIVKSIINGQLMRDLDNINPYDELSALTRVTPIGDGGVASSHSIVPDARNIDSSYFGNLDSMDTSENENVGILNHLTIDAAVGNKRGSFGRTSKEDRIGAGTLSVCSSVVPFVNHNDGCRVMFSGSQGRQTIPILGNQQPLVQTGYETMLTSMLTDSYIKKAQVDGTVTYISENVIQVTSDSGAVEKLVLDNPVLKTSIGQIKGSLNTFSPTVKVGQKIKAGQILAEGKHIKNGVISVGRNLLTAMMGWKGYSFEDGYIISESVANTSMTSMSYEEREVILTKDDILKEIATSGSVTRSGDVLLIRSSKDVEQIIGMNPEEVVEGQQVIRSPGGKILSIEIYPNISVKKFPVLIPEYEKFRAKYIESFGSFPEKFVRSSSDNGVPFSGIRIVFKIERYDQCTLGDKITNNHGGKGTLTMIEKDANMPITPWGERIDLLFNPLAVINRMNPGTIYELCCGLVARTLARRVVAYGYKKNIKAIELMSTIYTILDNTKDKVLSRNLIHAVTSLSEKAYVDFINSIVDSEYVMPVYVPQFQEPSHDSIKDAMKILSLKTKYNLYLPEYKMDTLNPVAVGYLYWKKLEQQAAYKTSARSIGKYSQSTGQATAGKAHGGGQRLGEMDSYSLISQGAIGVLRELMGPLSDDKRSKDEIISKIIESGSANYQISSNSTSKDRLNIYLLGMMVLSDIG